MPCCASDGIISCHAYESVSWQWYLEKFTDAFSEDLDKIRVQVRMEGVEAATALHTRHFLREAMTMGQP